MSLKKALIASIATPLLLSGCLDKGAVDKEGICNSSACIESLCPGYSTASYGDENTASEVCSAAIGSCEINMPLTFQMGNGVPGEQIACGAASAQMIINAVLASPQTQLSGFLENYSGITPTADPTGSSTGFCNENQNCRQILSIGTELIGESWATNFKKVTALETNLFFEKRAAEISSTSGVKAKSYESGTFPSNINQCTFVSGEQAITNSHPWSYSILYLEYPVNTKASHKDDSGANVIELTLKDQVNGHYIAMSGYDVPTVASAVGINYKFHDPIAGIINYFIVSVKENEPVCVSKNAEGACSLYLNIKQLPANFKGEGAFLLSQPEEIATDNNYTFKFIASASAITPLIGQ